MKILSIDWDYFFPDLHGFDWGMSENHASFLQDALWTFRYSNVNYLTREIAFDLKPNFDEFWQKIKLRNSIRSIVVADSHADIVDSIKSFSIVWNVDQHHDCGYGRDNDILSCENWALDERIVQYNLIYPAWRKDSDEKTPQREVNIFRSVDDCLIGHDFDVAFICRSGAWTPPWTDKYWLAFLDDLARAYPRVWGQRVVRDDVLKERAFDIETAKEIYNRTTELIHNRDKKNDIR